MILSCEGEETIGGSTGAASGRCRSAVYDELRQRRRARVCVPLSVRVVQHRTFRQRREHLGELDHPAWAPSTTSNPSRPRSTPRSARRRGRSRKAAALAKWLGLVGALTNNQLPVWFVRNNVKALSQPPSTEWLHLAPSVDRRHRSATQYFSADTPIGASGDKVCGRVVYSALHVSGGPNTNAPGVRSTIRLPGGAGGAGGATGTGGCAAPAAARAAWHGHPRWRHPWPIASRHRALGLRDAPAHAARVGARIHVLRPVLVLGARSAKSRQ